MTPSDQALWIKILNRNGTDMGRDAALELLDRCAKLERVAEAARVVATAYFNCAGLSAENAMVLYKALADLDASGANRE